MSGKHERFTTAVNDSTGDLIKTKASNQQAYADNWERIFQKPKDSTPKAEQALSRLVDEGVTVFEEEPTVLAFTEELLPSGIIGEEI